MVKILIIHLVLIIQFVSAATQQEDKINCDQCIEHVRLFDFNDEPKINHQEVIIKAKRFAMFSIMLNTQYFLKNGGQRNNLLQRIQKEFNNSFIKRVVESFFEEQNKDHQPGTARKKGTSKKQIHEDPDTTVHSMSAPSTDSLTSLDSPKQHALFDIRAYGAKIYDYVKKNVSNPVTKHTPLPVKFSDLQKRTTVVDLNFFESNDNLPKWIDKTSARDAVLATWRQKIQDLEDYLKFNLSGQDDAISVFVSGIFNHYANIIKKDFVLSMEKIGHKEIAELLIETKAPSSILILGPSGTGKTEMVQLAAKFLGYPVGRGSGSNLSPAGYKGDDPADAAYQLVQEANALTNPKRGHAFAEKFGIIFLDEIDKLAVTPNEDRFREGSQNALLTFIEGSQPLKIGCDDYFNSSSVLFILAGAFSRMIPSRMIDKQRTIMHQDLIDYGLRPELVNRIYRIVQTNPLTKEDLLNIIVHPKNSPLYRHIREYKEYHHIRMSISMEALDLFAQEIEKHAIGARNIYSFLEKLFSFSFKITKDYKSALQSLFDSNVRLIADLTESQSDHAHKIKHFFANRQEKIKTILTFIDAFGKDKKEIFLNIEKNNLLKGIDLKNPDIHLLCEKLTNEQTIIKDQQVFLRLSSRAITIPADFVKTYFAFAKNNQEAEFIPAYFM